MANPFRGFTILELSIVLIVISYTLVSSLRPLSVILNERKHTETRQQLQHVEQAIIGFSVVNKSLPCPDMSGNGLSESNCTPVLEGFLPWKTIALERGIDAWGNRLRYRVDSALVTEFVNIKSVASIIDNIDIKNAAGDSVAVTESGEMITALLIYSCGLNGRGDVLNNSSADCKGTGLSFSDSVYSSDGRDYDDVVAWISIYTLINQLALARII